MIFPMHELPSDVVVEEFPGGVRLVLPRRALGKAHRVGFVLLIVGVAIAGGCVYSIVEAVGGSGGFGGGGVLGMLFTLLHALPFMALGAGLIALGWAVLTGGHSTIAITAVEITNIERAGVFRYRWSRSLDGLRAVDVATAPVKVDGRPVENEFFRTLVAIRLDYPDRKPMLLAPVYPRAIADTVAREVARRIESLRPGAALPEVGLVEETGVAVRHTTLEGEFIDRPAPRPATTRITLDARADGVTISAPPQGVARGAPLFVFGMIWMGIIGTVTYLALGSPSPNGPPLFFLIPFLGIFWVVGLGVLFGGIATMRVRYIIDVIGPPGDPRQVVVITRGGVFRTTQLEWPRGQILGIAPGPSSWKVNDRTLPELQFRLEGGKVHGVLTGATQSELEWLAWELRRATGAPG